MTKKFATYQEMLEDEDRLTLLLKAQQQQLQADVRGIKDDLQPITHIADTAKKFFTRKATQGVAMVSMKLLIDGLVKNFILAKAGWITRLVVPFFLKNYASHLAEDPEKLVSKIKHMFSKNGKVRQE